MEYVNTLADSERLSSVFPEIHQKNHSGFHESYDLRVIGHLKQNICVTVAEVS